LLICSLLAYIYAQGMPKGDLLEKKEYKLSNYIYYIVLLYLYSWRIIVMAKQSRCVHDRHCFIITWLKKNSLRLCGNETIGLHS